MEFLKIVALSVAAAVLYGIVHDQITIRICPEYFTVFHPQIFRTQSLTLLALFWGVFATWWAGVMCGVLLGLAARAGREPKIKAAQLFRAICVQLALMAACAAIFGFVGFETARTTKATADFYARLMADSWTHDARTRPGSWERL